MRSNVSFKITQKISPFKNKYNGNLHARCNIKKKLLKVKSSTVCNTKSALQISFPTSKPIPSHWFKHLCSKPLPQVSTKNSLCKLQGRCITQGKLQKSRSKTKCLLKRCQGVKKADKVDDDVTNKSRNCVDSALNELLLQLKVLKI